MWQSTQRVCPAKGPAAYSLTVEMASNPEPGTNCSWHPPQNDGCRSVASDASARALWSLVQSSCATACRSPLPPACSGSSTSWQPMHVTPRLLCKEKSPVRAPTGSWQPTQRRSKGCPSRRCSVARQKSIIGSSPAWAWTLAFHAAYSVAWQPPQKSVSQASTGPGPTWRVQVGWAGRSRATTAASAVAICVASGVGWLGSTDPPAVPASPAAPASAAPPVGKRPPWSASATSRSCGSSAAPVYGALVEKSSFSPACPICASDAGSLGVSDSKRRALVDPKPSRWQPPHDSQSWLVVASGPLAVLARKKSV